MNKLGVLLCVLALAGWGQTRSAATKAPSHSRPPVAARHAISDADLEKAILAKFARSKIAADKFQVRVSGGVATISGRADVIQHKGTATRLARTAGAVQVVNKVQLSQAAREKAAANLDKGRRRAQIKRGETRSQNTPATLGPKGQ
jgi:osmotically-inducible protein OsmY